MEERQDKLQELRRDIFKDIVRLSYSDELKEGIDNLAERYTGRWENGADGGRNSLRAVKNEFLIAMGLNPTARYDTELAESVDLAYELQEVEEPLVTVNRGICEDCRQRVCDEEDICINNPERGLLIEDGRCISCGKCIPRCPLGAISDKVEFIPLVKYLREGKPIFANVAPAVVGQFGENVNPGRLRTALKAIGFSDLVEVALFADLLTLREADEYNELVKTAEDFLITSCCCPVWINLLNKHYPELSSRLTKTVSPMIASGRVIKAIFPGAVTVFIGPCIAKKAEARTPELRGAIDYVLTFDELNQIFEALEINPSVTAEEVKEQSSYGGRIYGRTGGVSEAVRITVERLNPRRTLEFKAIQADGVADCKKLLDRLAEGKIEANFIEGMGCRGGCVGGPKRNIPVEEGRKQIEKFGEDSRIKNPIDNRNITHILKYLSGMNEEQSRMIDQLSFDKLLLR